MLHCSSECGSISIMQLRTIYCNTHVHTFHVCLYVYLHLHLLVILHIYWNAHFKYIKKALTKNSHMISHMKPEFHIWNWNFTCEIKISHMNYRISYMKPNNSYVKNYMWNRITYEFLDSYMKFLYVKTNHIWNLYVKTYHIWNPQFIYEILYVKTNHIWNFICENKSHMKFYMWRQITYETLDSYVKFYM